MSTWIRVSVVDDHFGHLIRLDPLLGRRRATGLHHGRTRHLHRDNWNQNLSATLTGTFAARNHRCQRHQSHALRRHSLQPVLRAAQQHLLRAATDGAGSRKNDFTSIASRCVCPAGFRGGVFQEVPPEVLIGGEFIHGFRGEESGECQAASNQEGQNDEEGLHNAERQKGECKSVEKS
jgi:hypothetical protein